MIEPGPLTSFDTETTGVNPETARIVSAFIGLHFPDGTSRRIGSWLINPGVPIPPDATKVHGITDAMVLGGGQNPADALLEIESNLATAVAQGIPVVIMNAAYDLTLLDREIGRHHAGRPLGFDPRPVVDPLVLDKSLDTFRRGSRTLTALAEHYKIPTGQAHDAEADATLAAAIAMQQIPLVVAMTRARGWDDDRITLDALHDWQISWREKQQEGLAEYHRSRGKAVDDADYSRAWPLVPRAS